MMKMYDKVVTAAEAVSKIPDNAFLAVAGINVAGTPLELLDALVDRYNNEGHPKDIDLTNSGNNAGISRLAVEGMLRVYYAGFPAMDHRNPEGGFTGNNVIPVFHFTQGIGTQFYRAQASGVPYLTKAPIGTYVDPRLDGACANDKAREFSKENPIVKIVEISGQEYLHIDLPPVTVTIFKATSADTDGNLIDDDENIKNEILPMALAAHNNGGIVIAQVNNLLEPGQIDGADVRVPGMLVDYIVVCSDQKKWAPQNVLMFRPPEATGLKPGKTGYEIGITGHYRVSRETIDFDIIKPSGTRMMMARRAITELWPGCVANIGMGVPTGIPYIAAMEEINDMYYQTVELGAIGGFTGGVGLFGAAYNARSYLKHDEMFSFIDGQGLDIAILGAGEVGEDGTVNVTRVGGMTIGSGGFVSISANTHKLVFLCTHTTGGKSEIVDGKLNIVSQGKPTKFVKQVEQVGFNGKDAVKRGQDVTYVTERAVFKLIDGKLTLVEFAPGLDVEKDILSMMEFRPEVSPDLKPIPDYCFNVEQIGMKEEWKKLLEEM